MGARTPTPGRPVSQQPSPACSKLAARTRCQFFRIMPAAPQQHFARRATWTWHSSWMGLSSLPSEPILLCLLGGSLRDRLLHAAGYDVASVPWSEWETLPEPDGQDEFLRDLLREIRPGLLP